ncbi:hypothetical protein [Streptomyces sp. NPDC017260]|uniref:hypothetical protein n=1 Tax=unclassified Streptomyces TaxID=2593676 RepID=UPI00379AF428
MPADEVTRGTDVESFRARTGPRHAAPKKPLFTRLHMPAGKAIALAAMPTAVLMGLGFTPTLALADGNDKGAPPANSMTAEEYKACVEAMTGADKGSSASPAPSQSSTDEPDEDTGEEGKGGDSAADEEQPSPSTSAGKSEGKKDTGSSSSSDSGSDDEVEPTPNASASQEKEPQSEEASPSASDSGGGLLEGLGDAIEGIFTGGEKAEESPSPTPTPSASASEGASKEASDTAEGVTDKATGKAEGTAEGTTGAPSEAGEESGDAAAKEEAGEATASASAGPDPSESASADPEDCPVATDAVGGVDNSIPLPDAPWHLEASSLLLKGASYEGIVEVKTASGNTKKVLKYVISKGTDIGDLHQIVKDEQIGKTYHVQAAKGSTSTIRDGDTVMYTESISGNLLGLIPITFDPEHPPPLDIPLIYFTDVKVVQAGQFGGTLHIPGLHQHITD